MTYQRFAVREIRTNLDDASYGDRRKAAPYKDPKSMILFVSNQIRGGKFYRAQVTRSLRNIAIS